MLTPKEIEQYETSRKKGFLWFVLVRGILMWGLVFPVGAFIASLVTKSSVYNWAVMLPTLFVVGAIYGVAMWHAERMIFIKKMELQEE